MTTARTELTAEMLETIARAIHDGYRAEQASRKPAGDPALRPWEDLPAHLQESNRAQARHILVKLRQRGYSVYEAGSREGSLRKFPDEDVEDMAQVEHDRWTAERLADGWTLGAERDVLKKISPNLVGWAELPEDVKEWDRETVRRIPDLLAGVGLEVHPIGREAG